MSSSTLQITLIQFDIRWEQPVANMEMIENMVDDRLHHDLILLPEMWSTGFTMNPESHAESTPGPALQWMVEKARRWNSAIAGSIAVKDGSRYYNRWYCTFPDGRIDHYDKKHLFSFGREDLHYTPGDTRIEIELKGWKIRPVICYDLRFPAWCRNTDTYDLFVVVANWPIPRIHHWDALLKARSIENQCYTAAVNRIGTDGSGLEYNGHSGVYDMDGTLILTLADQEEAGRITLDKEALVTYRDRFRFLQDRDQVRF